MKTLTFGNLKIDLDLDPHQEEILIQALMEDVRAIQKHQAWLRREAMKGSDSPNKDIKPEGTIKKVNENEKLKRKVKK